jgi:hypothetical protein
MISNKHVAKTYIFIDASIVGLFVPQKAHTIEPLCPYYP